MRPLGKNQAAFLAALARHEGRWGSDARWVWGTSFDTLELCRSLEHRGLVADVSFYEDGHRRTRFQITDAGRAVVLPRAS